jgi:uncharacterized membrane protein YphA (DoxX/SURF4 family)
MLGLLKCPAVAITAIAMLVALFGVHWGNGFFLSTHGIEYALALLSVTSALLIILERAFHHEAHEEHEEKTVGYSIIFV